MRLVSSASFVPLESFLEIELERARIICVNFELTSYPVILGSTTRNPLKRSRELSGLDIDELGKVDQPSKRSKTGLDHMIRSKSTSTVSTIATRTKYPLPKPRKVLQATLSRALPSCNLSVAISTLPVVDTTVFEIHEDTADEEMSNMLTHSANALDISDDETRIAAKMDRGKENVPPTDNNHAVASISTARHAARKAITWTKPRTPLGSLNITDFYPEAYNVDSVIIVPAGTGS